MVTDIKNVSGIKQIHIPAHQFIDHEIIISPKKVATSSHIVTYVNRNDRSYVWYTVKMVILSPPPEDMISLSTQVRNAIASDIKIYNPLDIAAEFNVKIEGFGLSGIEKFNIEPKIEKTYTITFAPGNNFQHFKTIL